MCVFVTDFIESSVIETTHSTQWTRDDLAVSDLQRVDQLTISWHSSLPVFEHPNRRRATVQAVLIGEKGKSQGEIDEVESEHDREGMPDYDVQAHQREALDTAVPAHAFAFRRGIELDLHKVHSGMNGFGARSGVYDHLREVVGNLPEDSARLKKDLEWLLIQAYSLMWHLPEIESPVTMATDKMLLNRRNYPTVYFSDQHPTGRKLRPDEQEARYQHSVRCLRTIRKHYDRKDGLLWSDHAPFAELILDFEHADSNHQKIQMALTATKAARVMP